MCKIGLAKLREWKTTLNDVEYWTYNWRKHGGGARMYDISKREKFYQQEYCGCIYSLRDTNEWREKNGRDKIEIGEKFYEEKIT